MTTARNLAAFGTTAANYTGRNKIINGGFDVWQRGTSFTISANGYSADRWRWDLATAIPTGTISQQAFTVGNPISGYEPTYFQRTSVTANNGCTTLVQQQRIEDVRTFAGQNIVLSFWAKADAAVSMNVDLSQNFGSGGSATNTFLTTSVSLTTSWKRFTVSASVTSISGKTIGSSSFFQVQFSMPTSAGVVRNGTYDLWGVQVEAGVAATPFEFKSYGQEFAECQRYYTKSVGDIWLGCTSGGLSNTYSYTCQFPVRMRATPVLTTYVGGTPNLVTWYPGGSSSASDSPDKLDAEAFIVRKNGVSTYTLAIFSYTASAEL